ncbi:glutathione S-transferase N-terminal domain-containing protein [Litoribrevibacter albus]|uniref:Glutathione S-transferase n=1 Tax=Litoribrevibacter albus TaxID=1473156 RepID=A0AA37W6T0_9GAMM|nr:glutathione S-transferase N-terminal domain-containing protein [Litoribrevibacter albus]GLQ31930.1 glutathione S-transferase [Litoribrevibacter albus]
MFEHLVDIYTSTLVSTLTGWKGTSGSRKTELPADDIVLFDRELCPECRTVRQAVTELNLDVMVYPCPEEGDRFKSLLEELSGSIQLPFLFDKNSGQKLVGKDAILEYLFKEYGQKEVPEKYTSQRFNGLLEPVVEFSIEALRLKKGKSAKLSNLPEQPLILYSFESSPFSRPVRERLCELEIPYKLVNLGKQQRADMGPAGFRMHTGPYVPVKGSKREAFLAKYNDVMVPFLIDPNTGQELFHSKKILAYLNREYAKH